MPLDAPLPPSRTPAERAAARARFIRHYGVWRFGVGMGIASAVLFFGRQQEVFSWRAYLSVEFIAILLIWIPIAMVAGYGWGARFHDRMRDAYGWSPPDE